MTRGRHPERALEKAQGIAQQRGLVHYYKRGPGIIADFSITSPACKAEVRIKRMRRIRFTLQSLEREAEDEIAGLKIIPSSIEISRELWICSPEYFWRFIRVCDTGLAELSRDGTVLPEKSPVPERQGRAMAGPGQADAPVPLMGTPSSRTSPVPPSGETDSPSADASSGSIDSHQDP